MISAFQKAIDGMYRPEYTGENRCMACTTVNVVIATVVTIAMVYVLAFEPAIAILTGGIAFLLFIATIYLRGYLVPGTPWITKRYFPGRLLRWFDTYPELQRTKTEEDVNVEGMLKQFGVVTECQDVDDLCLDDEFRTTWRERIIQLRDEEPTNHDLATILNVDTTDLSVETFDDAFVANIDGGRVGQWESRAAFLADMAAAGVLQSRLDSWTTFDSDQQSSVLNGLRIFLEQCPACDGPVTLGQERVESCCRSIDVVAVSCRDCGARVFEAGAPEST